MGQVMSKDGEAFAKAGMLEACGIIGDYNLFMVCDSPNANAFKELPDGYSFRLCRRDELEIWERMVVVDERYVYISENCFNEVYASDVDEFFRRCLFVCDSDDTPVASCFIWRAYGRIDALSWFKVLPGHEGKGIGRALLTRLLRDAEYPVYLHTQPTSVCAIKLYSDFGFEFITNPRIGYRENNLTESLPYLERVMHQADFAKLRFTEDYGNLNGAALISEIEEF